MDEDIIKSVKNVILKRKNESNNQNVEDRISKLEKQIEDKMTNMKQDLEEKVQRVDQKLDLILSKLNSRSGF